MSTTVAAYRITDPAQARFTVVLPRATRSTLSPRWSRPAYNYAYGASRPDLRPAVSGKA